MVSNASTNETEEYVFSNSTGLNHHITSYDKADDTNSTIVKGKLNEKRKEVEEVFVPCCKIEDYTRFSECHLWKLMMAFYDRQGVESWAQGIVPHFITCNAFIGRSYAKTVVSYLNDCMRPNAAMKLDPTEPLYIIELGTGSGKFSYYMMKFLLELKEFCSFPMNQIKYIMTDFTEKNFEYWTSHPALQEFVTNGMIDFAIFNATCDKEFHLSRSNITLRPGSLKNPMCIVANYLFDTLYHDLFQIDQGEVKEGLISVGSTKQESDPLDPDIIKRLSNKYMYKSIDETTYYKNEEGDEMHLNNILSWYKEYYTKRNQDSRSNSSDLKKDKRNSATILVPIGALRALRRLLNIAGNRAFVLSGDKGNSHPDHFEGLVDPHIAVHGSFSVMVNYHAIGLYFASRGGYALHNPQEEACLKVSIFLLNQTDSSSSHAFKPLNWLEPGSLEKHHENMLRELNMKFLCHTFNEELVQFGPNDFFIMQKSLKEDSTAVTLRSIVSLLKLSCWDPDVFYKFRDIIMDQLPSCGRKLQKDLCYGLPFIWKNHYDLDKEKDIAFEIGRVLYGVHSYKEALVYYTISVDTVGEHHVTYHNMGLCYYRQKQPEDSLIYFQKAVDLNPSYEKAQTWLTRVQKEISTDDIDVNLCGDTTGHRDSNDENNISMPSSIPTIPALQGHQENNRNTNTTTELPPLISTIQTSSNQSQSVPFYNINGNSKTKINVPMKPNSHLANERSKDSNPTGLVYDIQDETTQYEMLPSKEINLIQSHINLNEEQWDIQNELDTVTSDQEFQHIDEAESIVENMTNIERSSSPQKPMNFVA